MSREAPIPRDCCPAVLLNCDLVAAGVDHRLNGQYHSLTEPKAPVGLPVVRNWRLLVQLPTNSMPDKGSDHRKACALHSALDGPCEIAEPLPFVKLLDPFAQSLFGHPRQAQRLLAHLPITPPIPPAK